MTHTHKMEPSKIQHKHSGAVITPSTKGAEEQKIENLYANVQEEADHIPKQDMMTIIGD